MTAPERAVALLDVNVLIALFDPDHPHFDAAHRWFVANEDNGWATCPLTENGVIRILSNPAYSVTAITAKQVHERLSERYNDDGHHFWPDSVSLTDVMFDLTAVRSRDVTDVYLLGLAVAHGGRLATFDSRIPARALGPAGIRALEVISL